MFNDESETLHESYPHRIYFMNNLKSMKWTILSANFRGAGLLLHHWSESQCFSPCCSVPFSCHWQLASCQLWATYVCGNKTKVKTWSTWEKREKVSGKWAVATQRQGTLLRGLTRRRARWLSTSREARYQTKTKQDRTRSSSALCAVFRYQPFEIV